MNKALRNFYLAEVPLSSVNAGQRYLIGDIPALKGRKIVALETFTSNDVLTTPAGNGVVGGVGASEVTVSFTYDVDKSTKQEQVNNLPYTALNGLTNSMVLTYVPGIKYDLSKSYITVNSITDVAPNQSCLIGFYYE